METVLISKLILHQTLTSHYTHITVAVGQNVVERRLLRQTTNHWRLGRGALFLFLLQMETLHLIGQTHHLSSRTHKCQCSSEMFRSNELTVSLVVRP